MESKEYQGHWWLPGEFDNRSGGVLNFHPEQLSRLSLFSALNTDPKYTGSDSIFTTSKIFGQTTDGSPITLLNCKRDKYNTNFTEFGRQTNSEIVASYILDGYLYENQNPAFDSLKISFPFLEDWARLNVLDQSFQTNSTGRIKPSHKMSISYTFPEIPSGMVEDLEISLVSSGDINTTFYRSVSIDLDSYMKINPQRNRVPLSEYLDWISKLNNFVAFATDRPVAPEAIEGEIDGTEVNLRYPTEGIRNAGSNIHPYSFLFNYHHISLNFPDAISEWFTMSEELKPVLDLYFGTQFREDMYENNSFLSLSQAVESYHRLTRSGRYHSEYKYDEVLEDFKTFLYRNPEQIYDHSGSLKSSRSAVSGLSNLKNLREMYNLENDFVNKMKDGTLKFANEYSLRKRLSELVEENKSLIEDLPYNIVDKQGEIIDTRNYLTHYAPDLKYRASQGEDLRKLTWGLQQLLEVCLLRRIGIHESVITERLKFKYDRKQIA